MADHKAARRSRRCSPYRSRRSGSSWASTGTSATQCRQRPHSRATSLTRHRPRDPAAAALAALPGPSAGSGGDGAAPGAEPTASLEATAASASSRASLHVGIVELVPKVKVTTTNGEPHYLRLAPDADPDTLLKKVLESTTDATSAQWLETEKDVRIRASTIEKVSIVADEEEAASGAKASEERKRTSQLGRKALTLALTGVVSGVPAHVVQQALDKIFEKKDDPVTTLDLQRVEPPANAKGLISKTTRPWVFEFKTTKRTFTQADSIRLFREVAARWEAQRELSMVAQELKEGRKTRQTGILRLKRVCERFGMDTRALDDDPESRLHEVRREIFGETVAAEIRDFEIALARAEALADANDALLDELRKQT